MFFSNLLSIIFLLECVFSQFNNNQPPRKPYNPNQYSPNQYNQHQYYQGSNSNTIQCDQSPFACAGRTMLCLHETCKYECQEVGSCANAKFITSPNTKDIEILCNKPNACKGIQVLSGAINTKVQCEDYSCISIKLFCKSNFADKCELKCQSNGCVAKVMDPIFSQPIYNPNNRFPNVPRNNLNLQMFANEVYCKGNIRDCHVIASNEYSFLNGKFTCDVGHGGRCILECADSWGEVSCRGSQYHCISNPAACQCIDQRNNNNNNGFNNFNLPQNPIRHIHSGSDCPKIQLPTRAPTRKPTIKKASKPKKGKKGAIKVNKNTGV